jgi:hypothetical protein
MPQEAAKPFFSKADRRTMTSVLLNATPQEVDKMKAEFLAIIGRVRAKRRIADQTSRGIWLRVVQGGRSGEHHLPHRQPT